MIERAAFLQAFQRQGIFKELFMAFLLRIKGRKLTQSCGIFFFLLKIAKWLEPPCNNSWPMGEECQLGTSQREMGVEMDLEGAPKIVCICFWGSFLSLASLTKIHHSSMLPPQLTLLNMESHSRGVGVWEKTGPLVNRSNYRLGIITH